MFNNWAVVWSVTLPKWAKAWSVSLPNWAKAYLFVNIFSARAGKMARTQVRIAQASVPITDNVPLASWGQLRNGTLREMYESKSRRKKTEHF